MPLPQRFKSACEVVAPLHRNVDAVHEFEKVAAEARLEESYSGEGVLSLTLGRDAPEIIDTIAPPESVADCRPLEQVACGDLGVRVCTGTVVVAGFSEGMHVDRCCDDLSLKVRFVERAFVACREAFHLRLKECVAVGREPVTLARFVMECDECGEIGDGVCGTLDGDTVSLRAADEVAGRLSHGGEYGVFGYGRRRVLGVGGRGVPCIGILQWDVPEMFCEQMQRRGERSGDMRSISSRPEGTEPDECALVFFGSFPECFEKLRADT